MNADGGQSTRSLGDALEAIREGMFVGREPELEAFARRLDRSESETLFIHGPGGIGKTTLLRAFERRAQRRGLRVVRLGGPELPRSRGALVEALGAALGTSGGIEGIARRAAREPTLVLVDGFEAIASMEAFIGHDIEPALAPGGALVAAGRAPPTATAWRNGVRPVRLDNLSRRAARTLLERRGVATQLWDAIYETTRGYPLALALVLSLEAASAEEVHLEDDPDLVAALLERVIGELPTTLHRRALRLASISHRAPRALLERIAGEGTDTIERWLRGLSFVEEEPAGLAVHDVVRDCIVEDLRWRNPEELHELRCVARDYYLERLRRPGGHLDVRAFEGAQYLFRHFEAGRAALEAMSDSSLREAAEPEQMLIRSIVSLTGDTSAPKVLPTRSQLVRELKRALRTIDRADLLKDSPLLEMHVVPRTGTPTERARALSDFLIEQCHRVRETKDGDRLFRVLERTYLDPAVKQLAAAIDLDMSYATYRRWLRRAVERVAELVAENLGQRGG